MAAITLRPVDPRPSHCSRHPLNSPHYELGIEALPGLTVPAAFDELARAI